MSNDYKHTAGNDYATQGWQGSLSQGAVQCHPPYPSLADHLASQQVQQQCKPGGLGSMTNKPIDRGLCQEAAEILGMIHSLESLVLDLRTHLFGSFPEVGECGKAERDPSLSEMLVQSRIALGRLIEEVSLLRSKSE